MSVNEYEDEYERAHSQLSHLAVSALAVRERKVGFTKNTAMRQMKTHTLE